ncbi:hypothetical protein AAEY27_15745 [Kosakonia sp. BYX6]|uniref:Uncharacterized protein n=1 Tax=Kosakonia calanthes TaxID=3139408 RepID=A0ABZ3B2R6_9ENTR
MPLGNDGFWLNVEGVDSRTKPKTDCGVTSRDRFQRLSTRVGYHWVRGRDFNTSTLVLMDVQNETQHLQFENSDIPFTEDASPNNAMLSLEYARGSQSGESQDDRFNLSLVTFF